MKKYIWIIPCFFILLYFAPSLTLPVSQSQAAVASAATDMFESGNFSIRQLDSFLTGCSLHFVGYSPLGLRLSNILVVALMSILGMFAVKKCINDSMTGIIATLIFFTSYWCFYTPVSSHNTVWGEFFNVLALGAFFMASRENRFSLQRISLLLFCGFLTALSLIINGISPFLMSFVIAVVFLLWDKKYIDMLLMPSVISVVTIGFLLLHGHYLNDCWLYELKLLGCEFVNNCKLLFNSGMLSKCVYNLKIMVFGIMPSLVFLICAVMGYKGYVRHFFKQGIYKFTFVFLCVGIISVMLNQEVFLADLPLTYLPYSFLVGAGVVNYFRTRNRYILFNTLMLLFVVITLSVSIYELATDNFVIVRNFAVAGIIWSAFVLLSFVSPKTSSRLKAYFLGLAVALFASMTVLAHNEISASELKSVLSVAVDPESDDYELYATSSMYHLVRFYLRDSDVKEIKTKCLEKLPENIVKNLKDDDVVIFASKNELAPELMNKSRTVDAGKFRLHLFMEKK